MYKAILEVDGKVYSLSSININTYNRGSGYDPSPNDLSLVFQIRTTKMDQFIWNWISTPDVAKKNGKIKLIDIDENVVLKTIIFENGYSSSYNMNFYQNNDTNDTSITLSASKITIQVSSVAAATPGATKD
ncbi:MAG: hypothetical protein H0W73_05710 [Bacteroidetes bacterium]|nr:hypothetical protein [Bacteroidota bacterium]